MNWANKLGSRFWENLLLVLGFWLIMAAQSMAASIEHDNLTEPERKVASDPGDATMGELYFRSSQGYVAGTFLHGEVDIVVTGLLVKARVTQTFKNLTLDWQEATYAFPLPENAAVHALRVKTGDRIIEGEIQEKAAARKTYSQAKAEGKRAALVEQQRSNMFTTDVSHIAPGGSVEVEIEYLQQLALKDGIVQLRFPTTMTPRYTPDVRTRVSADTLAALTDKQDDEKASDPESVKAVPVIQGWQHLPLESISVPQAPVVLPGDVASNSHRLKVTLNISPGFMVDGIHSLTHALHGNFVADDVSGGYYEINLGMTDTLMNRDLVVEWSPSKQNEPQLALYTEQVGGDTYGLLFMTPPNAENVSTLPRELVFVVDTSGSMGGRPIVHARQVLHKALSGLRSDDKFNVVRFSSDASAFASKSLVATPTNLLAAQTYVDRLDANGGTEMSAALDLALPRGYQGELLRQVVFITDGSVSNEQALFGQIEQSLGNASLFTVGIGSAPNSYFMRKAAQFGRGTFTQIDDESQIEGLISQMLEKLGAPLLRDIEVIWPEGVNAEVYPGRLPDLYAGDPLAFTFRLSGAVGEVKLLVKGLRADSDQGESPWQRPLLLSIDNASAGKGADKLWARNRIAFLKDEHVRGVDKEKTSKQILATALQYGLVSDVTSLVAVDHTPVREVGDFEQQASKVPSLLPAGMSNNMLKYPGTDAGSLLRIIVGSLGMLLGFSLLRFKYGE